MKNAVQEAVDKRNPHVIAEVRKRVEFYYALALADALSPIPGSADCVLDLAQSVTLESAEAAAAMQRLLSEYPAPTLSTIEAAAKETGESQRAGAKCFDLLTAMLHKNTRPQLMIRR